MKNLKKTLKLALTGIMLLAILTSSFLMASADPGKVVGSQTTPAIGTLSKVLEVSDGVEIPDLTFSYAFEKVSVDTNTSDPAKATMPDLSTTTAILGASTPTSGTDDQAGLNLYKADSPNFLPTAAGDFFPHAGAYVYNVTETASVAETLGTDASITYSDAQYEMIVHVANEKVDGKFTGKTYVSAIEYRIKKNDAGEIPVDEDGDSIADSKADPVFTNRYKQLTTLEISKTVAGEYGDLTREFDFSVTLNKSPAEEAAAPTYVGKIFKIGDTTFATQIGADVSFVFSEGDTTKTVNGIKLKHDEVLIFATIPTTGTPLPTGTTYTVTENLSDAARPGEKDYLPSVIVTENGGTPAAGPVVTAGESLTVPVTTLGEDANIAAFTNTHQNPTITGVLINNLPYIMLILLAVGGLIAFIAFKRKKSTR